MPRRNIAMTFGKEKTRMVWLPEGETIDTITRYDRIHERNNNNNNNIQDNVYGAVIMAEPLREFTRFI